MKAYLLLGGIVYCKYQMDCRTSYHLKFQDGDQPLHRAAWEGNREIVKLLLDRGADTDSGNKVCIMKC